MNDGKVVLNYLKGNSSTLNQMAKDIWNHPQVGLEETYASNLISKTLEEEGFSVKRAISQMPTAFVASWGDAKPVIGILGEYDALPGLSQKVSSEKEPIEQGEPGHGCGHNLIGVGSLGAVLALKEAMREDKVKGTIRYYGCPAEETLIGKVLMAKDGAFDDLDAALIWHPRDVNTVRNSSTLALNSFKLNFHGVSCHPQYPGIGRSALDAVILTDVGINYLRDNIIREDFIHGVITNGGVQPNIIPPYAQSWYFVRAPNRELLQEVYKRVIDIAKGAASMTGTTLDVEFITGCYDYMPNDVITTILLEKLEKIGAPKYTAEEKAFAKELGSKVRPEIIESALKTYKMTIEELGGAICDKIISHLGGFNKGELQLMSNEVGDVSYIAPTGQVITCCLPVGVGLHTWQSTASCGSTIGFKGMMLAAKTMALTVMDLILKPGILDAARREFRNNTGGKKYISPINEVQSSSKRT